MATVVVTFLFIGIGWYLLIRPQQQRARAQQAFVAALQVGDRVISAGGIHGTITRLDDDTVGLQVAPGVELTLARAAVAKAADAPTDPEDEVNDQHDGPIAGGPA
ncbi:MAG TPA: preprotein translocase subunit YajC [Aquihabitans sp.]|nr:preprotein translocase subunit YajC [Aquihabitans sp.]